MATFINNPKSSSPTWEGTLRRGRDTTLRDIKDKTFEDDVFGDGTALKDEVFSTFQDTEWAKTGKSADPTWANTSRS